MLSSPGKLSSPSSVKNRWWGGKLIARVIVKQRLERGEEVNAASTRGKYTLCKGSRSGQS